MMEPLRRSGEGARYLNRELSWLDFNARVLALAEDARRPAARAGQVPRDLQPNLDEFFQVRVAGLQGAARAGVAAPSPDGMTQAEQLDAIRARVAGRWWTRQRACSPETVAARARGGRRPPRAAGTT